MRQIVFTAAARADLQDIALYLKLQNFARAEQFVAELRAKCMSLGDRPTAFAVVPRFAAYGLRKLNAGNYLIFYRASEEVEIIRIVHGARDYENLLLKIDPA